MAASRGDRAAHRAGRRPPDPPGRSRTRTQHRRRRRAPAVAAIACLLAGLVVAGTGWWLGAGDDPPAASGPTRAATATTTPTPPAGPRVLTVLGSGDVLIHPPVWQQAQADADGGSPDFYPIFTALADTVSEADLAICHLETPVAPHQGPFHGYPRFSAPPQVLPALAEVGYDSCSTASNHTLDRGEDGVYRTIDELEGAGLAWAGSARTEQEAATATVLEVETGDGRPVTVGQLSYTFSFNQIPRPRGKEWIANLIDRDQILDEASTARTAGAEIVILSLHWGQEYQVEPTGEQVTLAQELIASGEIDLILGHHAHVVQPAERFDDGSWVIYGMGNQLARHAEPIDAQREGIMAMVTFTEQPSGWAITEVEAVPTWVELTPEIRLVDLAAALADPDLPDQRRATYQAAYDRIVASLDGRDASADGLVVR